MTFTIDARPYSDPDVVRMVAEVQSVYAEMYGGPDEAVVEPGEFVPPRGLFLVGALDDIPVATAGWRRLDGADGVAEIKRMCVSAAVRRHGLARLMLAEVERTASAAGVRRLVLNTGPAQTAAIALYVDCGYAPTPAFGYYAQHGEAVFLARDLELSMHDP